MQYHPDLVEVTSNWTYVTMAEVSACTVKPVLLLTIDIPMIACQ